MDTSTPFEPRPGGVDVSFVRGVDRFSTFPDFVKQAHLGSRFAVVQETYVEGCTDMHFEEPLWRALVDFLRNKFPGEAVDVTTELGASVPVDRFLTEWDKTVPSEHEPPPVLTASVNFRPIVCMVTDYWTRVGGPRPYHDSYTYSIYSDSDLGDEVMSALADAACRSRWTLAPEVIPTTSAQASHRPWWKLDRR